MLDIKLIRENPDAVRSRLATRGAGEGERVARILALDERRRKGLAEVESLKSQRNKVSKEIGALMGQKKLEEAEARKQETRDLGDQIAALDKAVAATEMRARIAAAGYSQSAACIRARRQERRGQSGGAHLGRETRIYVSNPNPMSSCASACS